MKTSTFMSGKVLLTSYADLNFLNKTCRVIEIGMLIHEKKKKTSQNNPGNLGIYTLIAHLVCGM